MARYQLVMSADDIPMIVNEHSELLGRALTRKDGETIVTALNITHDANSLRDRLLAAVTDAIEECFDA